MHVLEQKAHIRCDPRPLAVGRVDPRLVTVQEETPPRKSAVSLCQLPLAFAKVCSRLCEHFHVSFPVSTPSVHPNCYRIHPPVSLSDTRSLEAAPLLTHVRRFTRVCSSVDSLCTYPFYCMRSGIGGGIDSFFEYLMKAHLLTGKQEYLAMFEEVGDSSLFLPPRATYPVVLSTPDGLG